MPPADIAKLPTPRTDAAVVSRAFIEREMDAYTHKFVLAVHARRQEQAIAALIIQLENSKEDHASCEDCWYSCPKSSEGCCDERQGDACNCGADAHNGMIDETLTAVREHLGYEA